MRNFYLYRGPRRQRPTSYAVELGCALLAGLLFNADASAEWKPNLKWLSRKPASSAPATPRGQNAIDTANSHDTVTLTSAAQPTATQSQPANTNVVQAVVPVPAAEGNGQFTLASLEQLALSSNPTIQQAAALIEKAGGQFDQAGLYPNPVVGYQASEVGNEGRAGQQGVFASQEFVRGGKLGLAQKVASHDIQRLRWQYEVQAQRVRNEVRIRYYELLGAKSEYEITTQLEAVATEGVKISERLTNVAKVGSQADILQAEIDLNQVQISQQAAERRVNAAQRRLAFAVGNPQLEFGELTGHLAGSFETRDAEQVWQQLLNGPQLQAATWRVNRAQSLIERESVQATPNVEVQLGTQYDNASRYQVTNIQVGMPLPVFNRNQGNIRSAYGELRAAQEEQRRLELALQDQLAEALKRYETSRFQVQRYEEKICPKAAQNLKLTTEGYEKFGQFDFLRVLVARRSYYETNLAYIRALTELRQAEVALDGLLLTGGLDAPVE